MIIKRLELYNVGPYKGKFEFDFDTTGIVLLKGEQGSGKTTILNSLAFGLFNELKKADKKIKINDIQNWYVKKSDGFYVVVEFLDQNGDFYRVINSRNHPMYGSSFSLYLKENGKFSLISDNSDETKQRIQDLIKCDYITFVNSVYIRQKSVSVLMGRASERLNIFLRLINLEQIFNSIDKEFKKIISNLAVEIEKLKSKLDVISSRKIENFSKLFQRENLLRIWLISKYQEIRDIKKKILILNRTRKQISYYIEEYEIIADQIDRLETKIKSSQNLIKSAKEMIKTIEFSKGRELNSVDDLIQKKRELEDKRKFLSSKMNSLLHVQDDLEEAKGKLERHRRNFTITQTNMSNLKNDIKFILNKKVKTHCGECGRKLDDELIEKIKNNKKQEIQRLKDELKKLEENLQIYGNGVIEFEDRVKKLRDAESEYLTLSAELSSVVRQLNKIGDISQDSIIDKYNSQIKYQKNKIKTENENIISFRERIYELEGDAEKYEEKLERFGGIDCSSKLDDIESELSNLNRLKNKVQRDYLSIDNQLTNLQIKINSHFSDAEKYDEINGVLLKTKNDLAMYELLRQEVKDFRFYIVEKYLESINSYMNKFLKIFGFPYKSSVFKLEKNELKWVFYNDIEWKDVRNLSGGESQSLLLSGVFAFFKVLSSHQISNTILCDEPLSGLDSLHQEKFFRFLDDFRAKDMLILISSHSDKVNEEHFDFIWNVVKNDKYSFVEVL